MGGCRQELRGGLPPLNADDIAEIKSFSRQASRRGSPDRERSGDRERELHRAARIAEHHDTDDDTAHSRHGVHRRHHHSRSKAAKGGGGHGGGRLSRETSVRYDFNDERPQFATPAVASTSRGDRGTRHKSKYGRVAASTAHQAASGGGGRRSADRAASLPPQSASAIRRSFTEPGNSFGSQSTPIVLGRPGIRADADELARVAESPGRKLVRVSQRTGGSNTSINSSRSMPAPSSSSGARLTTKTPHRDESSVSSGPGLTRKVSMMI